MRIKDFQVKSQGPIKLCVSELSDVVVFAGPNGVGKTNIGLALLNLARNPTNPDATAWMIVESNLRSPKPPDGGKRHSTRGFHKKQPDWLKRFNSESGGLDTTARS